MGRKARVVLLCSYLRQFISSASLLPEVLLTFDEQASRPIGKKVRGSHTEPSGGPSDRSLSGFLTHETARSISTSPWMGC